MMEGGGGGRRGWGVEESVVRKGPWMAEEDEILLEYVSKYGPRDWSSIRSKGLLPRTGKSCRLRWVNKLKPDLKTGCKFSSEEERTVIDLQSRFGNKWARIATYLPGRTDNDVKNFWSTRQKRLARILQTPLLAKSQRNYEKTPGSSNESPAAFEAPKLDFIPFGEESSAAQGSNPSNVGNQDLVNLVGQNILTMDISIPSLEPANDQKQQLFHTATSEFPFTQLPHHLLDLPLLPEGQDLDLGGSANANFQDLFALQEANVCDQFPEGYPFFGVGYPNDIKREVEIPGTPDTFFNDLPADLFDYLELPPPTSSLECSSSQLTDAS